MSSKVNARKFLITSGILAAILLLGLVMRLINLGSKSIYVDEAITVYTSMRSLDQIVPFMMQVKEVHPPLYFWFIRIWMGLTQSLTPESVSFEFYMRFSSVLFGVLTIYFTYLLGRRLFSVPTGLIAAFLIAISTFHVYYSQELRMYPMLLFFMMLSIYSFLHLLEKPGPFPVFVFILAGFGAIMTHYFGFFTFIIEGTWVVYLLSLARTRKKKKKPEPEPPTEDEKVSDEVAKLLSIQKPGNGEIPVVQQAPPGLAPVSAPEESKPKEAPKKKPAEIRDNESFEKAVEAIVLSPSHLWEAVIWLVIGLFFIIVPYLWWIPYFLKQTGHQDFSLRIQPGVAEFFDLFTRMTFGETLTFPSIGPFNLAPVAAIVPLLLIGWSRFRGVGPGKIFADLWLLIPLGLSLLVSLTRFHVFEFKYFFIVTPALWMLIADSLVYPPGRKLPRLLVAIIIAANLVSGWNWQLNHWYQGQEWRGSARTVKASMTKGERVIVHPSMMAVAFAFYFPKANLIMPMDEPDPARLEPIIRSGTGVWVVTTPYHPYVRKIQLVQYLKNFGDGKLAAEFPAQNPSNVIRIYHFSWRKDLRK